MTTGQDPTPTDVAQSEPPGTIEVELTLNRAPTRVEVDPSEPLAYTLRERLGLTGTKVSCDVQACGACTVLVDGLPRSSCTYLTYETAGRTVLTVEGLAPDRERLGPLQEAFVAENGLQCGFCTPGMLLTAHAWLTLDADAGADGEDLLEYMSGNLCRCTGYLPIVAAILRARAG
jgi:aerobic-type carbon monoxide dehydrogenase small subunit (CoxS/CutS family)